jgi:peroxiredoxin
MKSLLTFLLTLMAVTVIKAQGYKVGDKATDFKLENVDGKFMSLSDFPDAKGFVIIFTCNHCPFAKAYEDRIIEIDKTYRDKGYPVIAINPNDPKIVPEDSFEAMVQRSKEKGYTFPYLLDAKQEIYKIYGATKTPHVFLLKKDRVKGLEVKYIGTIDDNYQDAGAVTQKYLANAIDAVIADKLPNPDFTKAIGCSIKDNSSLIKP